MTLTMNREPDLSALLQNDGTYLTVCFPIDRENAQKNRIRLKNGVASARELLEKRGDASESSKILETLQAVQQHDALLSPTYPGLALLLSLDEPDRLAIFPLWRKPKVIARLESTPHLLPLLRNQPLHRVLVVHLADNGPSLLRGHFGHLEAVPLPEDCPSSLQEVIRFERQAGLDGNESFRDRSNAQTAGTIHGEGPVEKVQHEFEARYHRTLGEALTRHIQTDERVLLAGVEENVSLFRSLNNDLPHFEVELHGNFDGAADELKVKAQKLLERLENESLAQQLQTAQTLPPEGFETEEPPAREAALQNRIATLFLNGNSEDLERLEDLAAEVLNGGGKVHIVEQPSWTEALLATYRW